MLCILLLVVVTKVETRKTSLSCLPKVCALPYKYVISSMCFPGASAVKNSPANAGYARNVGSASFSAPSKLLVLSAADPELEKTQGRHHPRKPCWRLCFCERKEGTAVSMSALNWKPFVYGSLASITVEWGTFPTDLTKTRLQIQGQKNDADFKEIRYGGMLHALVRIGREEGLKVLYLGIAPAMVRQASYGTIKIGTYQSLKRLFVEHPKDETLLINVVCGILWSHILKHCQSNGCFEDMDASLKQHPARRNDRQLH